MNRRKIRNVAEVGNEEDTLLFNLNKAAAKKGRSVLSLRASKINDFSTQYGGPRTLSYSAENLIGPPSVYPLAGDSPYTYHPRTYGKWYEISPSHLKSNLILPPTIVAESQDYIEFYVPNKVAPKLLRVYEVYNPGAIVKVLCFCYETEKWVVLWRGEPEKLEPEMAHCFTVNIEGMDFMTDLYRLEFHHKHLNYYCEIDGVVLYGENKCCYNFLTSEKTSNENCASNNEMEIDEESQNPDYMSRLPSEVISHIFSFLDLRSLCSTSSTCRLFKKVSYDPALYRDLNLQPYWHLVDEEYLMTLEPRLSLLKKLNLSWCGGQNRITLSYFGQFLEVYCQNLTTLKLANCSFVNDDCLRAVAKYCPSLKELSIRGCSSVDLHQSGFKCIAQMSNLIYLDLYRTMIDDFALNAIITSLKLKHLSIGDCKNIKKINDIVFAISKYLRSSLISLDVWRLTDLRCPAIYSLSFCTNLMELDISWCGKVDAYCGCIKSVIESCPKLKKLFMAAIRTISNSDLNAIAMCCPDMEQLDILGSREYDSQSVIRVLQNCKKLKLLDISYSSSNVKEKLPQMRSRFSSVSIKFSYTHNVNVRP